VAAEALEARAMEEAIVQQAEVLGGVLPGCRRADVEALSLAALLAGDVDLHS
jgi:hypothetical protein